MTPKPPKPTSNEGFYELPDGRRDDATFFAELLNEPDLLRYRPEEVEQPDASAASARIHC